jgi:tRNA dimethylallyltransferase
MPADSQVPATPPHLVIGIAGATATGKSAVALALARKLKGEIIAVDSMQVYRGLDIGTAKPSTDERALIRHHLIDVADLTEAFDASQFAQRARAAIADILSRGRVPILCGGTGLYFKALLEGLGDAPPANPALRAKLEATPLDDLLRELAERDPATHQTIDTQNPRRVVRAVEVIRLTGKPFSSQRAAWSAPAVSSTADDSIILVGLSRSPEDLRRRIEVRVGEMFERGLVEETRRLLEKGLGENKTAMQAIGYRQVVEHLRGGRTLPETVDLVKSRTRQFARRQRTWFTRQLNLRWMELKETDTPELVADALAARFIESRQGSPSAGSD